MPTNRVALVPKRRWCHGAHSFAKATSGDRLRHGLTRRYAMLLITPCGAAMDDSPPLHLKPRKVPSTCLLSMMWSLTPVSVFINFLLKLSPLFSKALDKSCVQLSSLLWALRTLLMVGMVLLDELVAVVVAPEPVADLPHQAARLLPACTIQPSRCPVVCKKSRPFTTCCKATSR